MATTITPRIERNGNLVKCATCGSSATSSRSFTVYCAPIRAPYTANVCDECVERNAHTAATTCQVCANVSASSRHSFAIHCKPIDALFVITVCNECITDVK